MNTPKWLTFYSTFGLGCSHDQDHPCHLKSKQVNRSKTAYPLSLALLWPCLNQCMVLMNLI